MLCCNRGWRFPRTHLSHCQLREPQGVEECIPYETVHRGVRLAEQVKPSPVACQKLRTLHSSYLCKEVDGLRPEKDPLGRMQGVIEGDLHGPAHVNAAACTERESEGKGSLTDCHFSQMTAPASMTFFSSAPDPDAQYPIGLCLVDGVAVAGVPIALEHALRAVLDGPGPETKLRSYTASHSRGRFIIAARQLRRFSISFSVLCTCESFISGCRR